MRNDYRKHALRQSCVNKYLHAYTLWRARCVGTLAAKHSAENEQTVEWPVSILPRTQYSHIHGLLSYFSRARFAAKTRQGTDCVVKF